MKTLEKTESDEETRSGDVDYRRSLIAFWIFGFASTMAYIVMLCAAYDILDDEKEKPHSKSIAANSSSNNTLHIFEKPDGDHRLSCNKMTTGTILLADIFPALLVKFLFPFFQDKIPYFCKTWMTSGSIASSFLIIAFAPNVLLKFVGVTFASFGQGLGEITFLGLTTYYHKNTLSMWSSGMGGAGILGTFAYAGLRSLGVSSQQFFLVMLGIPMLMITTYFVILGKPPENMDPESPVDSSNLLPRKNIQMTQTFKQKLQFVPSLFDYICPVVLVYFLTYIINQGLMELIYFDNTFLSKREQYRWNQFVFRLGVFVSRSSVNLVHIRNIWAMAIFQFINAAIFFAQVLFPFLPNVWVFQAIIAWEGLLAGATYVNAFFKLTQEVSEEKREFSIGLVSMSNTGGVALAGAVAIPLHNAICGMDLDTS